VLVFIARAWACAVVQPGTRNLGSGLAPGVGFVAVLFSDRVCVVEKGWLSRKRFEVKKRLVHNVVTRLLVEKGVASEMLATERGVHAQRKLRVRINPIPARELRPGNIENVDIVLGRDLQSLPNRGVSGDNLLS
jgi:hypothetical protein